MARADSAIYDDENVGKAYDWRLVRRLMAYLRPFRILVVGSILLLVVHSGLGVVGPYLTKVAVDNYLYVAAEPDDAELVGSMADKDAFLRPYLPADPYDGLAFLALLSLGTLIAAFGFRYLQTYVMQWTGQRVMYGLRRDIFSHMQTQGVPFYDRNAVGRLVTRVTSDVDVLNELFTSGVVAIFGDLLTLLFIVGAMLFLSPKLTLVLLIVAPLVAGVSLWFRSRAREGFRGIRTAVAKLNAFLQEHLSGISVVQLFNHEARSREDFSRINNEHFEAQKRTIRAHALFFPSVEWLGVLGVAGLLVFGSWEVVTGSLQVGVVVAFLQYGSRVFRPIQDLSEKFNVLQAAMASAERIFGLLDRPEQEPLDAEVAESLPPRGGSGVEFRDVWFAYRDEDWVLRGVSFAVKEGETLALVGHTGAGKTTIISLLLRFYDVQKGQILVDGVDVKDWPLRELRRRFGVVLQDSYVFTGTVAENIRMGDETITDQRIRESSAEVNLARFVEKLAGKYDEVVGEGGSGLSTGQKQLISFARALARKPEFLILDEATSSVDTETEILIQEALEKLFSRQTSIVIAHRLSTIQRATHVLVLHKGEIREHGKHSELLAQDGVYAKLYRLQYEAQQLTPAAS